MDWTAAEAVNQFVVLVTYRFFGTCELKQNQEPIASRNVLPHNVRKAGCPVKDCAVSDGGDGGRKAGIRNPKAEIRTWAAAFAGAACTQSRGQSSGYISLGREQRNDPPPLTAIAAEIRVQCEYLLIGA